MLQLSSALMRILIQVRQVEGHLEQYLYCRHEPSKAHPAGMLCPSLCLHGLVPIPVLLVSMINPQLHCQC